MSKSFQYSKTSEINNIFLNPKIKQIIVNFIYDNLKPFSIFVNKELKTKEDLTLLKDKNFYIQNKHNGESSFLLFLRNKDRYYSCIVNKKHLTNDPKDIIIDDVFIIPFDVSLEIKIYDGTIIDGIYYSNKKDKIVSFYVSDVLLFRGENKLKDNIRNKFFEISCYFRHFNQNKIIINDIKPIREIKDLYNSRNNNICGLLFYYFNSGYSFYFDYSNKTIKSIDKHKEHKIIEFKPVDINTERKELKLKLDTIKSIKDIVFNFTVKPQQNNQDLYDIYIKDKFVSNLFLNLDTHTKLIKQLKCGNNIIKARYNKIKKQWVYVGEEKEESKFEVIKFYFIITNDDNCGYGANEGNCN